ncbi:MAG: Maf family protein [Acidobacteriota bacterium]
MRLILASASPRRAELLTSAGFSFEVRPADVDESPRSGEAPNVYALRVARDKAAAALTGCADPDLVFLAADTVVVVDELILGKPRDDADAERMLRLLANRTHQVLTAVVVRTIVTERFAVVATQVRFRALDDLEIAWYVASGEPIAKAGAYAIQGRAARFVDWIEGSWSNVVGLPIATVDRLLADGADRD